MMKLPSRATGTVSAAQFNALLDVVDALVKGTAGKLRVGPGLQMQQGSTDTVLSVSPGLVSDTSFWARITANAADGDRFKYSWVEVEKTGDGYDYWTEPGTGGRSGTSNAYNGDEYADATYSAVPTGTVVRLRRVAGVEGMTDDEYWFCSNEDTGGTAADGFWAKIGSATAMTDRYKYAFTEQDHTSTEYSAWTDTAGGTTGTCYNGAEYPTPTCRWRPVPANSIVWVREIDGEYWFSESMNQDTNTAIGASVVTLPFNNSDTVQDQDWALVDDKGYGAEVYFCSALWWDTEDGVLYARNRKVTIDDSGRVISIGQGTLVSIVEGAECPTTPA